MIDAPLKIAFMGTPDFAVCTLQALIDRPHDVVCVYSRAPRPKGRGHKIQKSPVHILADQHDIPVFTPKSLNSIEAQQEFAGHNVDVAIVAAYGLLLPEPALSAPKYGCLNIHASLLPRWRGASPIQHAIWKGDNVSGVTIMQMDKGLDTGDIIVKGKIKLDEHITSSILHNALAEMGAKLVLDVLDKISHNEKVEAQKQDDNAGIYAPLLKKSDGQVNWNNPATQIDRQVRALNPWPGVWAEIQGKRFKILKTRVINTKHESGLSKDGCISCGDNTVLQILALQPEGKKAMDFVSALNGGYINVGDIFL